MPFKKTMQVSSRDAQLIEIALAEDLGVPPIDATTDLLFPMHAKISEAHIISKHPQAIVFCGAIIVEKILKHFDPHCEMTTYYQDGQRVPAGAKILTLRATAAALLKAERTLLNFIRHLSGVATLTRCFVDAVKDTDLKILDTRKTTPGFRHLEKYAVYCGGGVNHRMGLYDAIMIKDTHIDLVGGLYQTLEKLPEKSSKKLEVIVEIRNQQELAIVLAHGKGKVDRVLLDNMTVEELTMSVVKVNGQFATESSGNITLENIAAIAKTGVNYASIGMLTYGAGHVDLSMRIMT